MCLNVCLMVRRDKAGALWPSRHHFSLEKKRRGINPKRTIPSEKHGSGSIMLWGCLSASQTGNLLKVEGIINKEKYRYFERKSEAVGSKSGSESSLHLPT